MSDKMKPKVEAVFGPSAGNPPVKETDAPLGSKGYWRNDVWRSQTVTRVLQNTHFLFDKEIVDHGPGGGLVTDKGLQSSARIVSVQSELFRDDEVHPGEASLLTTKAVPDGGVLGPISSEAPEVIEQKRVDQLARSLGHNADFISFCEFAMPPVSVEDLPSALKLRLFSKQLEKAIDGKFANMAKRIRDEAVMSAEARNGASIESLPFICYGSAHCTHSRFNTGVISPGGSLEENWEVRKTRTHPFEEDRRDIPESKKPRRGSGPIVHKKRAPARRAGERARVPEAHGFRLYRHKLGLMSVLICSDAMDINQFSNIIRFNQEADNSSEIERIFMVMIPAYNFSNYLLDACRDLSLSARTNVLVTNAQGESDSSRAVARRKQLPASEFFFMGRTSRELKKPEIGIMKTVESDEDLWVFDIDLRKQERILDLTKDGFIDPEYDAASKD